MNQDTIIIGAGASALMLASLMPKHRVTLIESNAHIGAKIRISGGGKCNITNTHMDASYFLGDKNFITSILNNWDHHTLLKWLKRHRLEPVLRKKRQYFCPTSAKELVHIFEQQIKHQKLLLNEKVQRVTKRGDFFSIKTNQRTLSAKHVIVASGGLSFPKIGASSIGYDIAKSFGHTVQPLAPALVGFTVQKEQFFFKELSGASTEVNIKVGDKLCQGSLLFAHKGMSGPAILDASLYWLKGSIEIDFLVGFSWKNVLASKKQISSLLPMPRRITKAFLVQLGLEDKPFNLLTTQEVDKLKSLNHYCFAPAGTFGYSKAEVTKGGVSTEEIDPQTMMSKKVEGLYFIGEVLDVTGRLGGYNFQWAFSSASMCFKNISKN